MQLNLLSKKLMKCLYDSIILERFISLENIEHKDGLLIMLGKWDDAFYAIQQIWFSISNVFNVIRCLLILNGNYKIPGMGICDND